MGDLSIQDLVVEYSSGGTPFADQRPEPRRESRSLVILLGPSGCGRRRCCRARRHPASEVWGNQVRGVDVTALDGRELAKYRRDTVGIVFQAFNLVPSLTALENVMVRCAQLDVTRGSHRRARNC